MLVFTHELTYSGGSLYLVELLRRLAAKPQFECAVVSLRDGPLRDDLEALRMPVHVTDPFPVTNPARYEGNQTELLGWAAPQAFNVAFVNTLGSFSGADLASRLGLPTVWAVHESFEFPLFWTTAYGANTLHPYVAARAERLLGEAAAVVFEAEATRKLFLPYADGERLVTVPYAIELERLYEKRASSDRAEARHALGLPQDARVVLCLGTIEPRKSQAMLAEAFARVADRHPDAMLVLAGEDNARWPAYTQGVRGFIERSGLESRIRVDPLSPDPLPWHAAADVHVCASDVESLPRSLLEAMAFGTPVVSTRVFGVPEVIDDGVTGYLCEPRDPTDLARALDRVLAADPDELRRVTRAAAELVSVRHEPGSYAERMWTVLAALAAGSRVNARELLTAEGMSARGNGTVTPRAGASATGRAAPSAV